MLVLQPKGAGHCCSADSVVVAIVIRYWHGNENRYFLYVTDLAKFP